MKTNIAYVFIIIVAAAGFLLAAEWLLYVAFAALLFTALVNFRSSNRAGGASGLPPGMVAPRQAQTHGGPQSGFGAHGAFDAYGRPLPKKKKKIRRPIIIVQPPAHSEALTHGILEESIKHSFPHFMTPQEKYRHEEEKHEKEELVHLLKEQREEMGELRKELEHVPGYRRKRNPHYRDHHQRKSDLR